MEPITSKSFIYPFISKTDNCGDGAEIFSNLASAKFASKFLEKRIIFFWGEVNDISCQQAIDKLTYLELTDPGKPITMYISSPGGSVNAGMALYDHMKLISSPVKTVCIGICASMASLLLSAGEKGSREIYPHGDVLIHQPLIGGYFQDKASNLEITANNIMKTKRMIAQILADNCGKTYDQVLQDIENDYWMDANESVAYGIADKITDKLTF
ncbi:MAG: ATP-dependent Clp protease proteolytic subunit [Bacteroidales bacterium]|nr:ATP-dependent Clp protease proteolytic subunit [Bacteroidales bacterium]